MTPQEIERTAELLLSLAGEHSVVVVEHDMEFVRSIARTVTVLHEGRVLAEGSMDEVQNDPRVIEVYLGSMSDAGDHGAQPVLRRQPHPVGRRSRRCRQGSRTCLMGRNGMGKTTLLKCIMGLLPAASGRDHVRRHRPAGALPAEARARLGIGYVPQGREIFSQLTVEENLRVGLGVAQERPRDDSASGSSSCSRC